MQVLLTGIPGSGKTLFMISEVDKISKRDNRPVFYHGINGLTLPWIQLTEDQVFHWWDHIPPNGILCLDEGQNFFRPAPAGRAIPEHITRLEVHRHGGIDFWLTTQDPSFVHGHWRKLAGKHFHFHRKFGMQWSTIYQWSEVQENPKTGRHNANEVQWTYPKEYYGVYKSAEVHTQKVSIPRKIIIAIALIFLIPASMFWAISSWYSNTFLGVTQREQPKKSPSVKEEVIPASPALLRKGEGGVTSAVPSPKEAYLNARVPVLEGMPHTAPVYAAITAPKRAPAPFACIRSKDRCQCYTDVGTRLPQVSDLTCSQIVEHGFFADWLNPPIATMAREASDRPTSPGARAPE